MQTVLRLAYLLKTISSIHFTSRPPGTGMAGGAERQGDWPEWGNETPIGQVEKCQHAPGDQNPLRVQGHADTQKDLSPVSHLGLTSTLPTRKEEKSKLSYQHLA